MTCRVSIADRQWLRANGISAGEALRRFVSAHRGDEDLQQLRKHERELEAKLAGLRAARGFALDRVAQAKAETDREGLRERAVRKILAAVRDWPAGIHRPAQLARLSMLVREIPVLRREDREQLLDELLGIPEEGR